MGVTDPQATCRLYAVIEAGEAAPERLAAALAAADLASVLVTPAEGRTLDVATAKPLVELAKRANVAVLLLADAPLAHALGADGVHLGPVKDLQAAYHAARTLLGKSGVVGIDAGISRHDTMTLAEAGADYVAFGAPAHLKDRDKARMRRDDLITWWAEIFQVQCVALDVETAAEAEALARDGADFIAVTLPAGLSPAAARDFVRDMAAAAQMSEAAT